VGNAKTAVAAPSPIRQSAQARVLQRACACGGKSNGECDSCKKKRLQRKAEQSTTSTAPPVGATDFSVGGTALPAAMRHVVEPLFGMSFGAVRVHDDPRSHALARDLGARAFTVGQDVHFASGEFRPDDPDGLHLLAHELTHTVQQRGVGASAVTDPVVIDAPDSTLEDAADASADAVVAGRATSVRPGIAGAETRPLLQRKEAEGTRTRRIDQYTTVAVTRSLIERPCTKVKETQATPRKDIFRWDEDAGAIRLRYSICNGKVQLESGATLDYSDVVRAAKELLRSVGSNPAGAPAAVEDAVNSATISASGHVSFTVSRTLDVTVSGESTAGTQEQTAKIKVRVLVDTASGKVQVIAEAGAGITSNAVSREVERFLRGQLNLGPVSIEVKFVDKTTTPAGGPSTSGSETSGRVGVGLGGGVDLGCSWTRRGNEDIFTCGPQVSLERPQKPKAVSCYACDCPPPRPDYTCRRLVEAHSEKKVDQTAGKKTERMLYLYDSDAPAREEEFKGQVAGVVGLVGSGYEVKEILGYASPEASRSYNKALGERRAKHARGAIGAALSKQQIQATLPSPTGVGELQGESSVREGKEAYDKELIRELSDRLRSLDDEGRLDLLGVDGPRRSDPVQRAQTLTEIQEFIDGTDAGGKKLGQRARWEKVFPHLRRVEVLLNREEKSHQEPVEGSDKPSACDEADKAFINAELGPIPEGKRLPQEEC
jgi:hypothetical protein